VLQVVFIIILIRSANLALWPPHPLPDTYKPYSKVIGEVIYDFQYRFIKMYLILHGIFLIDSQIVVEKQKS
jgi:hypothetical protein